MNQQFFKASKNNSNLFSHKTQKVLNIQQGTRISCTDPAKLSSPNPFLARSKHSVNKKVKFNQQNNYN